MWRTFQKRMNRTTLPALNTRSSVLKNGLTNSPYVGLGPQLIRLSSAATTTLRFLQNEMAHTCTNISVSAKPHVQQKMFHSTRGIIHPNCAVNSMRKLFSFFFSYFTYPQPMLRICHPFKSDTGFGYIVASPVGFCCPHMYNMPAKENHTSGFCSLKARG